MKILLRKYCSILFLIAFLFPQIEQQVHAFEHLKDFHCSATDKHFHEQEHNCKLCDFSIPDNIEPITEKYEFIRSSVYFLYTAHHNFRLTEKATDQRPARAPPVV